MNKSCTMSSRVMLSQCGTYRYVLERTWAPLMPPLTMVYLLLNPSTADAIEDDPTIRRCIRFAQREGCTGLRVLNLFALRSTNPARLLTHPDPVGPENDTYIQRFMLDMRERCIWVAGWGVMGHRRIKERASAVINMLGGIGIWCLGTNADGSPKHPLYLSSDTELTPYTYQEAKDGPV